VTTDETERANVRPARDATRPWRLFGDELAAHGDATALEGKQGRTSYAELASRAAGVWRALRRGGAWPGDAVALISAGRGHDEAIGLVGALTMGAVAVPLDATSPALRIASILEARRCRAVIADAAAEPQVRAAQAALSAAGMPAPAVVTLDEHGAVRSVSPCQVPRAGGVHADHRLAAILHTSGSTGTPKPVPITWEGLDAFTAWAAALLDLGASDRVLRVAELIFDLAWFDHLATFRVGATLLTMARRDLAAGKAAHQAIEALRPTVVYGVPSLFMKLSAAMAPGDKLAAPLRALIFAGEVFPPRELRGFAERIPEASLYNFYGPTETNVCTYHQVERATLDADHPIPIGTPCPYARCWLIDGEGKTLEGPATGELIVEGPTTVAGGPHATRDRVERDARGLLWFKGRIDRMVKIRGYRVEPAEIEAALTHHPEVRAAAVTTHEDPRLGKTLRAAVTVRTDSTQSPTPSATERTLRAFLAERLPPYMVPDRVAVLEDLPLLPTGKVDYHRVTQLLGR
jgi:acyl-coenzyme A synthetase/AMP-(fatty) acid ligase